MCLGMNIIKQRSTTVIGRNVIVQKINKKIRRKEKSLNYKHINDNENVNGKSY